jgi:hypothetical protein
VINQEQHVVVLVKLSNTWYRNKIFTAVFKTDCGETLKSVNYTTAWPIAMKRIILCGDVM